MRFSLQRNTASRPMAGATGVVLFDHPAVWNTYVTSHPHGTLYHRFEWLPLIARVFGHQVFPLAMVSGDHVVGVFPLVHIQSRLFGRVLVSMPFVNYGGLLGDSAEIEEALWKAAIQIAREHGVDSIEARHLSPHVFIEQGKQHKIGMTLALAPTIEAQWKAFQAKLRNQIRKSELSGLSIRVGGATDVGAFYEVFARNMRDLGTPVYHRALFTKLFEAFPEACRVFSVWDQERSSRRRSRSRIGGHWKCRGRLPGEMRCRDVPTTDYIGNLFSMPSKPASPTLILAAARPAQAHINSRSSGARPKFRSTGNTGRPPGRSPM